MTDDAWLDTVRLARDFGTVSQLFPEGIETVRDLPYTLFDAIRSALVFLSFDELPADEQPPKRIWLNANKLSEWFQAVKRRRDERMNEGTSGSSAPIEDPVQNDAAAALVVG